MKKKYDDLTIKDIEKIFDANKLCMLDENLEWPCKKGCSFHFDMGGAGCCFKTAFYNHLWDFLYNNEHVKVEEDEDGDWAIEIPDEILEEK